MNSSDCGMGREGTSRRHALYEMAKLVQAINMVRRRWPPCDLGLGLYRRKSAHSGIRSSRCTPMPRRESSAAQVGRDETAASAVSLPIRVLIVDDDRTQLLMMSEILRQRGFEVVEARSGVAAQSSFASFRPDLVLLDIDMPELDGVSACLRLREQCDYSLPIVMVTGLDDAASIHRAFEAGATDFITKPVNWPLFHHRIDAILAAADTRRALATNDDEIKTLKRLAPDIALMVSRNGTIIEPLGPGLPLQGRDSSSLRDIWPERVAAALLKKISGTLKSRRETHYEFEVAEDGQARCYEAKLVPDGRDRVLMVVRQIGFSDVTQLETYQLAYYEPGTSLPNRNLLERCIEGVLTKATLQEHRVAIVCASFDHLRDLEPLQSSAKLGGMLARLSQTLRECAIDLDAVMALDEARSKVARISNRHFAFLLPIIRTRADAIEVAERISSAFHEPFAPDDLRFATPRIGIAIFPDHGRDAHSLLHAVTDAADHAPPGGCFERADEDLHASALTRLDFASELKWALEKQQLRLHYQPRREIGTGRLSGLEALLRWYHPLRGIVPLREVLPLAEATGLILPIGDWVIAEACRRMSADGRGTLRVAVNVSHYELANRDLPDRITTILDDSGLTAGRLELEFTEESLRRLEHPGSVLEALDAMGVRIVLDDFGKGLSSLADLIALPIAALKIDASIVQNIEDCADDRALCQVVISMAHAFGLQAIAKGVETSAQASLLEELGCDQMQGFFVCGPLPFEDIARHLDDSSSPPDA